MANPTPTPIPPGPPVGPPPTSLTVTVTVTVTFPSTDDAMRWLGSLSADQVAATPQPVDMEVRWIASNPTP